MPHQCTNCERTFSDGSKEMLSGCPDCGGTKFQFRPGGFGSDDDGAAVGASGSTGSGSATTAAAVETGPETTSEPPEPPDRPGDAVTRTVGNAAATVREFVSGSATVGADESAADADSTNATPPTGSDVPTQTGDGDDDIIVAESEPIETGEDSAQADARSQVVEPEDVPDSDGFDPATGGESAVDGGENESAADEREAPVDGSEPVESDDGSRTAVSEDLADDDSVADETTVEAGDRTTTDSEPEGDESDGDRTVAERPDAERAERPDLAELRAELNEQFESIRVVEPGQYELNLMELYDREEYIIALQEDGRYSIQVPDSWREADA